MARPILVTFTGSTDPYYTEGHEDGRLKGPVLSILDSRVFGRVVLVGRTHRREEVERTRAAIGHLHPKLSVTVRTIELADSTHHAEILGQLRPLLADLLREADGQSLQISLLSCPPEVHACLVLIVAAGEVPARLLNFRRTVHDGLAGPRQLRELDWSKPLARLTPDTLALLATKRDRWDDADLQAPDHLVPRHYFTPRTMEQAMHLSRHVAPVLICGEPGTQKQLFAALLHQLGSRHNGQLIILNCASLAGPIISAVLFGEDSRETDGKLRQADGGTLVLIKCQHLPAKVMLDLLKAADDGHYYVGRSRTPVRMNSRLVFTTDRDLESEVRLTRFPAEAWERFKLNAVTLPPLREHPADIALLAHDELERLNRTLPRPRRFSSGALAKLESHSWPSNISELRRVVEHAVVQAEQTTIQETDIALDLGVNMANLVTVSPPRIRQGFSLEDYLRSVKFDLVRAVLRKTRGNQSEAARLLGVTPQAISKYKSSLAPRNS
jgi:DNA-binding NtrC family response regulator